MRCTGCGKDIPFSGDVCPYCHRDKTDDKIKSIQMKVGTFTGLVGGIAAIMLGVDGWWSSIGVVIGFAAGMIAVHKLFARNRTD